LSLDFYRGRVSDDENAQAATNDAFDVYHYVARNRLAAGRLTVVDATNVQPEARKPLVALARLQSHPIQKFHDDKALTILLPDFMDGADIRMVQSRSRLRLSLKAR
jgi:AAA domain-containing protein